MPSDTSGDRKPYPPDPDRSLTDNEIKLKLEVALLRGQRDWWRNEHQDRANEIEEYKREQERLEGWITKLAEQNNQLRQSLRLAENPNLNTETSNARTPE